MQLIRCTAKLLKEMGLPRDPDYDEPKFSFLGQWHANLIHINRRKCILFVNDRTLFNFIVPDSSRAEIRDLPEMFYHTLSCVVASERLSKEVVDRIVGEYEQIQIGKSADRSVLGIANDLAFHYKYMILNAGGAYSPEIPDIIRKLNRMPMHAGKPNSKFPIDELRKLYAVQSNKALH